MVTPEVIQQMVSIQEEGVGETLSQAWTTTVEALVLSLPGIIGAAVVLFFGWLIGRAIGGYITSLADKLGIDRRIGDTAAGGMVNRSERGISIALGKIAKWFIYAVAVLAAASLLDIAILSQWVSQALLYIPAFIAGLLVILIGIIVADMVGDMIKRTEATTHTRYTKWLAEAVKVFLYFVFITIGLGTMGLDVTLLYIFARAAAWGLAIGIALAVGIGFGWGIKDHVARNIEDWHRKAEEELSES